MKSRIPFLFTSAVFLCLLTFSCEKTETYGYYETRIFLRAVPDDQRVKLYFYLCNYHSSNFPTFPGFACTPDPNAYFDIYQLHPDGTEKAKLASNVTDSFYVEGLPNRENAYFKLKSRVGRTRTAESAVVVVTPGTYAPLERLPLSPSTANVFPFYSPDVNKVVQTFYSDTFSGTEIKQFNPPKTRYAPVNLYGAVNWDATSRYFMGTTYNYGGSVSIYLTTPYLYDTEKDTLRLYNNLGNYDLQAPALAPNHQQFYFLSNEDNSYEYGLWTANIDGSQRRRLAPGLKYNYANPDYLYNQSLLNVTTSTDGTAVYASFYDYLGKNDDDGLYQINPATGEFVRLLDHAWQVQTAQPSPDHQRVVFLSARSGELAFWLLDLKTGEARQAAVLAANNSIFITQNPIYWSDNEHIIVTGVTTTGYILYKIKLTV